MQTKTVCSMRPAAAVEQQAAARQQGGRGLLPQAGCAVTRTFGGARVLEKAPASRPLEMLAHVGFSRVLFLAVGQGSEHPGTGTHCRCRPELGVRKLERQQCVETPHSNGDGGGDGGSSGH